MIKLFLSYPITLIFLFLSSLSLNLYFYFYCFKHQKEPFREILFKILGSHFFLFYLSYKILLQVHYYSLYPDSISLFAWINWGLVMISFFLFFISYLIRVPPISVAANLREILFPLFCAILPFGVYESSNWVQWSWIQNSILQNIFKPFYYFGPSNFVSMGLILFGDLLIVIGMFYLKSAFSIFIQARVHIQHGIYSFIRHPLYLGESLVTLGFCLFAVSWFNLFLTLLFIVLQRVRAYFEEVKLQSVFPSYEEYKKRTGVYFPCLFFRQAWFHSSEIQAKVHSAEGEIKRGEGKSFKNVNEALRWLKK